MNTDEKIAAIQGILGVKKDSAWGPISQSALDTLIHGPVEDPEEHRVIATSFADPDDIKKFQECKRRGMTDNEAFAYGDNGIGKWMDDMTSDKTWVALPREDWEPFGNAAHGKPLLVTCNGRTVTCYLGDTMPHRANIRNGAGIDFAQGACKAFGLKAPVRTQAAWNWA